MQACSKSSSENTEERRKAEVTSTLESRLRGEMTGEGDLPNPTAIQTLFCTFYRIPYTCGIIHQNESIAHVQPSKSLALQTASAAGYLFYSSMFRDRKVNSSATSDSCRVQGCAN